MSLWHAAAYASYSLSVCHPISLLILPVPARRWNGAPEWVREMSHYRLQRPPPLPTDVLKALEDDGEIKGRKQIAKVTESGSSSAGKGGSGGASSAS